MIHYPLHFTVKTQGQSGISTPWSTAVPGNAGVQERESSVAIPPEFEGPGGGYSPEDFYSLALINCFTATFKVIAEKSKLEYSDLSSEGVLTIDRDEKGVPFMKHFKMSVHLKGAKDADRAKRLLEKVSQSCMVLNSVKTEKEFEFSVN